MARDQLFLLKPDFRDDSGGPWYCPSCATLEGVLGFYPRLRELLDVQYLDFPRPRAAVIAAIGAENQGLPVTWNGYWQMGGIQMLDALEHPAPAE